MHENDFSYYTSSELDFNVRLKVEGVTNIVQVSLYQQQKEIERIKSNTSQIKFNTKYKDLALDSKLKFVYFQKNSRQLQISKVGFIDLFDAKNCLKQSRYKVDLEQFDIIHIVPSHELYVSDEEEDQFTREEIDRIDKLMRDYNCGDIPKIDWMDEKLFNHIKIHTPKSQSSFIYISFPIFDFPIIYNEKEYHSTQGIILKELNLKPSTFDPELMKDNPVENKHRKLARSHRTDRIDRELKPTSKIRDELLTILKYPPTKILSSEEKDLLWKFRFYLTREKKALTKFVKCVIWTDPVESKQAAELLSIWVAIDTEDSLELLSKGFPDKNVRAFAVDQLRRADDQELLLYLLQLVQVCFSFSLQ
jgi:phosphatidylinositol 3-kinase